MKFSSCYIRVRAVSQTDRLQEFMKAEVTRCMNVHLLVPCAAHTTSNAQK
jgi:hypothetical protein